MIRDSAVLGEAYNYFQKKAPVLYFVQLFKPFEKAGTKKTTGEKSTGFGMLISRKIIEAHEGDIGIDSKLSRGTIIHFKLPFFGNLS